MKQFVQDWKEVEEIQFDPRIASRMMQRTGDRLAEQVINPQNLTCEDEENFLGADERAKSKFPVDTHLETLIERSAFFELVCHDKKYRRELFQAQRYLIQQSLAAKSSSFQPSGSESNEAILTVEVYRPLHSVKKVTEAKSHMQIVPDQVYEVISSLPLSALRDQIRCVADNRHNREVSENPDVVTHGLDAGHVYKSGYFYINETFYNDMRSPECIDYSDVIIKWAAQPGRGIGPFQKSSMTETFADLTIQLGYPYLYVHQGNCEHLLVFSDLRLLKTSRDSINFSDYPKFLHSNRRPHVNCIFCEVNVAKWYVKDNHQMPQDPSFLCERCFRIFSYDQNREKISQFKAYPFLDKSVLV